MKTKFGNANIDSYGYYTITSYKEGNYGKRLHRLIWEDFYGKKIPEGYVIHHTNGDPLCNEIWNLQCCELSKHNRFHAKNRSDEYIRKMSESLTGRTLTEEHKLNMSKSHNNSGYYRVTIVKSKNVKQGFRYYYTYYEDGKYKNITSVSLEKLEQKVRAKSLKWLKY